MLNIDHNDYVNNIKILKEWHKKMMNQLILSSAWMGISFSFISFSIAARYLHVKGPYSEWLITLLVLIIALSFLKQGLFWRWHETGRRYTLSIVKDLLLACRQRIVLQLTLFIIYLITYILLIGTACLFYRSTRQVTIISLLINTSPDTIALSSLCIYNICRCKRSINSFDKLLKDVPSHEN